MTHAKYPHALGTWVSTGIMKKLMSIQNQTGKPMSAIIRGLIYDGLEMRATREFEEKKKQAA